MPAINAHRRKSRSDRKGQRSAATCGKILTEHDQAVAYFSPSTLRGKLRIGVTEHISMTEICGVISTFTHHHPVVDIQLVVEQSHLLRQHFSEGSLEIILHQDFTGTVSTEDKVLWSEKLYWYAMPGDMTRIRA